MPITINGSGTITGLSVGGLPDGTVDADTLASGVGGKILQVVSAEDTTDRDFENANTWYDTGLTCNITPAATSSKIQVFVVQYIQIRRSNSEARGGVILMRDSTTIWDSQAYNFGFESSTTGTHRIGQNIAFSILDTPNTTSAITYKTRASNYLATDNGHFEMNNNAAKSTMVLMEVAG